MKAEYVLHIESFVEKEQIVGALLKEGYIISVTPCSEGYRVCIYGKDNVGKQGPLTGN